MEVNVYVNFHESPNKTFMEVNVFFPVEPNQNPWKGVNFYFYIYFFYGSNEAYLWKLVEVVEVGGLL